MKTNHQFVTFLIRTFKNKIIWFDFWSDKWGCGNIAISLRTIFNLIIYYFFNLIIYYDTLSLSPMKAGATMWRWWYQSLPLAINTPLPMKCLDPCCCCHDLPDMVLYLDNSSFINSVSVRHILGSTPFQNINLFPNIANKLVWGNDEQVFIKKEQ